MRIACKTKRSRHRHVRAASLAACVALLGALGCDSVLDVDVPSRIPADDLESPGNAQILVNGAVADFDCALGAYVVIAGVLTDELEDATLTADRWPYDQRVVASNERRYAVDSCENLGVYTPLSQARGSADNVLRLLDGWTDAEVPNRAVLIATMAAYGAYARLLLGEMFCSAAISFLAPSGDIVYGSELTPQQLFQSADSLFDRALSAAGQANDPELVNLARVGKARTLLNLGNTAAAAALATQVPVDFQHLSTASTTTGRRNNRVYSVSNAEFGVTESVGPDFRDVTYDGSPDPRVEAVFTDRTSTTGVPLWAQLKYASGSSSIPIASGDEAQLIVAEGHIAAGRISAAVQIFKDLHVNAGISTAPLDTIDTPTEATAQLIDERRRELFLEGQRIGDVRRFDLTLNPPTGTAYRNGGQYGPDGSQLCLPLPDVERQANPNIP